MIMLRCWQGRRRPQFFRAARLCGLLSCTLTLGCATVKPIVPLTPLETLQVRFAQNPSDVEALVELTQMYFTQQDFLRARQYIVLAEKVLSQRHGDIHSDVTLRETVFHLGLRIAIRSGQLDDAARRCRAELERGENLQLRILLANLYEAAGDARMSERERRLILLLHPDAVHELVELARFYERSAFPDRIRRAHAAYQKYLDRQPKGADAEQARAALVINRFDAQTTKE